MCEEDERREVVEFDTLQFRKHQSGARGELMGGGCTDDVRKCAIIASDARNGQQIGESCEVGSARHSDDEAPGLRSPSMSNRFARTLIIDYRF